MAAVWQPARQGLSITPVEGGWFDLVRVAECVYILQLAGGQDTAAYRTVSFTLQDDGNIL